MIVRCQQSFVDNAEIIFESSHSFISVLFGILSSWIDYYWEIQYLTAWRLECLILVLGGHGSSPNVSGVIIKKVVLLFVCQITWWRKERPTSLDRAIWYDDAKMHCYDCCLSANTSKNTSNTPLPGSPNIYSQFPNAITSHIFEILLSSIL